MEIFIACNRVSQRNQDIRRLNFTRLRWIIGLDKLVMFSLVVFIVIQFFIHQSC